MRQALNERPLPHNLAAEKAVLGAVLVHSELYDDAASELEPEMFFRRAHTEIYRAMGELRERHEPIDLVTLGAALERAGMLEEVGGPAYVSSLSDGVPRSTNVVHYARLVAKEWKLRALLRSTEKLEQQAFEAEEDAETLAAVTIAELEELSTAKTDRGWFGAAQLVDEALPLIEQLQNEGRPVRGVSTGLVDLDRMTRGLQPGELILIAARTSIGKSALLLTIASHIAKSKPVAMFSLEMSRLSLMMRLVALIGQIDLHRLQSGKLFPYECIHVMDAVEVIRHSGLYIDDTSNRTMAQIRAHAKRLHRKKPLGLLAVDYLQLVTTSSSRKNDTRATEVGFISRGLKNLARELDVPVLALSQLSRAPEQRQTKRPQLSDLRESGSLEQDADCVFMLHRPDWPTGHKDENKAELIIGKQRNGPQGSIDLTWIKEQARFASIAQPGMYES